MNEVPNRAEHPNRKVTWNSSTGYSTPSHWAQSMSDSHTKEGNYTYGIWTQNSEGHLSRSKDYTHVTPTKGGILGHGANGSGRADFFPEGSVVDAVRFTEAEKRKK